MTISTFRPGNLTGSASDLFVSMRRDLLALQRQLVTGQKADSYGGLGFDRRTSLDGRAKLAALETYMASIDQADLRIKMMTQNLERLNKLALDTKSDLTVPKFEPLSDGRTFAQSGGLFEMVQLWVNLPARDKSAPPGYQGILDRDIPKVELPGGRGEVRVIAGAFGGATGPARTFTPIHVWDLHLDGREPTDLALPDGHTTALVVLRGALSANGSEPIRAAEVALFDRKGSGIRIDRAERATALLLCGEPIGEPIVGHGPFVMNRPEEIEQAIRDYRTGKMGHL